MSSSPSSSFAVCHLLGQEDEVELGIDGELERRQAAAADEAQPGRDPALDPDLLADLADQDVGVGRLDENGVLLDEIDAQEVEVPRDVESLFW